MNRIHSAASSNRWRFGSILLALALALSCTFVGSALAASAVQDNPAGAVKNVAARQLVSDGLKAFNSGDRKLGVTLLKRALDASPREGVVQFLAARAEFLTGDLGSAEAHFRLARRNGIPDDRILPSLLEAMTKRQEENKLLSEFPAPASGAKGTVAAQILRGRAMAMLSLGRVDDAAASMDRSLELDRSSMALLDRAAIADRQNDPSHVANLIDEALQRDPKNGHIILAKLRDLLARKDNDGAFALSTRILQQFPNDITAKAARIEVFLRKGQVARAKAELQPLLDSAPEVPLVQYYNALVLARTNNVAAGWKIAQLLSPQFVQVEPDHALNLSRLAVDSGYVDTGAAMLATALAKRPNQIDIRLQLASIRMRQGSTPEALRLMEKVKDTDNPQALDVLGLARLQTGDARGALDVLKRANQIQPQNPQITFHLAQALNETGDRNAARNLLKKLLANGRQFDDLGNARKLADELR